MDSQCYLIIQAIGNKLIFKKKYNIIYIESKKGVVYYDSLYGSNL